MMIANDRVRARIHWISVTLAILTFCLIVWGGHVNTTRSGMAFPDWPTSNTVSMVAYQPSEWLWQSDRFWEHGHRLFATVVGIVTSVLLLVVFMATPKNLRINRTIATITTGVFLVVASAIVGLNSMQVGFMEIFMALLAMLMIGSLVKAAVVQNLQRLMWLSLSAFASVCLQGTFGGYTVRNNLPDWTSTTHGMLAEMFLMIVLGIVVLSSKQWNTATSQTPLKNSTARFIAATWAITFVQFFLGALTRHTDSWGVSVSWPAWSQDGFFPTADLFQYSQVVIHFAHRTLAYGVALMVLIQAVLVWRSAGVVQHLKTYTAISVVAVLIQIGLGASILFTSRGELPTTMHVLVGVAILVLNTITMYGGFHATQAPSEQKHTDSITAAENRLSRGVAV